MWHWVLHLCGYICVCSVQTGSLFTKNFQLGPILLALISHNDAASHISQDYNWEVIYQWPVLHSFKYLAIMPHFQKGLGGEILRFLNLIQTLSASSNHNRIQHEQAILTIIFKDVSYLQLWYKGSLIKQLWVVMILITCKILL